MKIRQRLILGFGVLVLLLAVSVGVTLYSTKSIKQTTDRIVDLRIPTAETCNHIVASIQESIASLRGYMLTGNEGFKNQRHQVWKDLHKHREHMNSLSQNWTNPDNVKKWAELTILDAFKIAQQHVEDIAHTVDEQPAIILVTEAAPVRLRWLPRSAL